MGNSTAQAPGSAMRIITTMLVASMLGVCAYVAAAAIDSKGGADKAYVDAKTENVRQEHRQDLARHEDRVWTRLDAIEQLIRQAH